MHAIGLLRSTAKQSAHIADVVSLLSENGLLVSATGDAGLPEVPFVIRDIFCTRLFELFFFRATFLSPLFTYTPCAFRGTDDNAIKFSRC